MKKNKSLEKVGKIAEQYGTDKQKQIKELKRLVREGQKSGDLLLVGTAHYYIANAYRSLGEQDELLTNAHKAVMLLKNTNEYETLIKAYILLSSVYGEQENHQTSFINILEAYRLVRKHRIKGEIRLTVLNILSNTYHGTGDYKTSIRLLIESLKPSEAGNTEKSIGRVKRLLNLSSCYKDAGTPEKSKELLGSMAEWIDAVPFKPLVCDYYLRYAIISYLLGEWENGDRFVDRALPLVPEDTYPGPLYDDLRRLLRHLASREDKERASRIFALICDYSEHNPDISDQFVAVRAMMDYYTGFGEYANAAKCYERLDALYDRRMKEIKANQLTVQKRIMNTEAELDRLGRKMRASEELASVEPLTKLMNRSTLLRISSDFILTAVKKGKKVGGIFIDIDFFKECNDTYGHAKGDQILRIVADACQKEESANVRFSRYGGDEFFGITLGLKDDEVSDIAVRICRRIREVDIPHEKNPNGHRVTLSVGVVNVNITEKTDTIIEIANDADKAVYHAKNAGKNAVYMLNYNGPGKNNASFVRKDF